MEREGTEMKFRALVETAPDAIVIADGLGRIAIVNAQAEQMFGYTREELLGRPVEMLLPERVRDAHVHHRAAYHSAPRTRPMGGGLDLLGRRKDGSEIPVEISLSPLQTDGGLLVTSVIRDVTERRRAQDELRRRQREAEELARVGRAVSQSLSPSVATRQIAEGLRQLLPVPVAIVCGLNPGSENMVLLAVAGDDTGAFPAGLVVPWDTGATGLALHEGHVVSSPDILADPRILVAPAARARVELTPYRAVLAVPLILRGTAIGALTACDRPGRVFDQEEIRLAQAFADHATVALENTRLYAEMEQRVTERTADLEAANKELEAFAYSVSHDLRAPLRAMDGFSRMLMDKHAPQLPDEARRYLGVVRKSSQEMGQLIEDLLTFSRLGRQPVERRAVSLSRLAREAFEDLHAEREGRRVELVVGDPPECKADPRFLKQVFVNLLSNALKFTRAREVARIEVGGRREGSEHACFVRDNGVGFDMRYVDKLFGVFQRLHRAEDYEGTGVGLAIVQRIVHRHGGRVWAEGKLDQGATVYFTLGGGDPHA
jgi:PAS domain S-box-containing protein